jgi:hypothetical protein
MTAHATILKVLDEANGAPLDADTIVERCNVGRSQPWATGTIKCGLAILAAENRIWSGPGGMVKKAKPRRCTAYSLRLAKVRVKPVRALPPAAEVLGGTEWKPATAATTGGA